MCDECKAHNLLRLALEASAAVGSRGCAQSVMNAMHTACMPYVIKKSDRALTNLLGNPCCYGKSIGLARTVYIRRICPYIRQIPAKNTIYTPYIYGSGQPYKSNIEHKRCTLVSRTPPRKTSPTN